MVMYPDTNFVEESATMAKKKLTKIDIVASHSHATYLAARSQGTLINGRTGRRGQRFGNRCKAASRNACRGKHF